MATLSSTALTLADWAKRMDDNYKTAKVVELLSQCNEILDDALFMEGNLPTGHKTTIRTGLPSATTSSVACRPPATRPRLADRVTVTVADAPAASARLAGLTLKLTPLRTLVGT